MAVVHLPRSLVDLFPGAPSRLESGAASVQALVRELDGRWPGMWDRLCEPGPAIRQHINVFIDGEKVALQAAIPPGGIVRIIPATSGG
jgi:sulfur-carrier protein